MNFKTLLFFASLALAACENHVKLGTAGSFISASPGAIDFGSAAPLFTLERQVAIQNTGIASLEIASIQLQTGPTSAAFTVLQADKTTLLAGESTSLTLRFTPSAESTFGTSLLVNSTAENASVLSIALLGRGVSSDRCVNVSCNQPPNPCFEPTGACSDGVCYYTPKVAGAPCDDGNACTSNDACRSGQCVGTPMVCNTPPPNLCSGPNSFIVFGSTGTCLDGQCAYTTATADCPEGCSDNVCSPDVCAHLICPAAGTCQKATGCANGACTYSPDVGARCDSQGPCAGNGTCDSQGRCNATPKCVVPPTPTCIDAQSARTYDPIGSCASDGTCAYSSHAVICAFGCDSSTGQCVPGCTDGQRACGAVCVDTATDPANCGACGKACAAGQYCRGGGCASDGSAVLSVASGGFHRCALLASGAVQCWGGDHDGQLGDGGASGDWSPVPQVVPGLASGAVGVSAGNGGSCALLASGGVRCWGESPDLCNAVSCPPADVPGLTGVVAITQGDSHLCALLASGGVSCLGYNATGELGDGTTVGRRTPAPVSGLVSGVTAISAGGDQTCAVTSPGDVFCWGTIDYWSSSPEFKTAVTVPTKVPGLAAVASVSVGTNHTCAVVSGLVKCWGRNDDGQLGDGTFADSATPVTVSGLAANAIAVAAGNRETCALLASGAVACWGAVITDGDGSHSVADSATPVIVTGLAGSPTSLSIGQYSVSAVLPTGGVACWGTDEICNLGQNPCADAIAPVEVVGL